MPVAELPQRHAERWSRATRHHFLTAVRDGSIATSAFDVWLVQDYRFVADLLGFQARLLARATRQAQPVLASGAVALVDELGWFEEQAAVRGLDLSAPALPATAAYAELLSRLDIADVDIALTSLWTIERTYLDAWSFASRGADEYRTFVEHWTTPTFATYVDTLEQAADHAVGPGRTDSRLDDTFTELVEAETRFWDMACAD